MSLFKDTDERAQAVIVGAAALLLVSAIGGHVRLDMDPEHRKAAIDGALRFADDFISSVEARMGKQ